MAPPTREQVFRAYLDRQDLVSPGSCPPRWVLGGFLLLDGPADARTLIRIDLETGERTVFVDASEVRRSLSSALAREVGGEGLPFSAFDVVDDDRLAFDYDERRWILSQDGSVREAPGDSVTPKIWFGRAFPYLIDKEPMLESLSPDGEWFASVQENNIVLRSANDAKRVRRLTRDGSLESYWDFHATYITDPKPQPTAWSPDSRHLLAFRRNVEGVFQMPRIDWMPRFETVEFITYQKAGAKLDRIEPYLVEADSGRTLEVELPERDDRYIFLLGWHPAGEQALLAVYTRDFKRIELVAVDRASGRTRVILHESAPTWVRVQHEAFSRRHGFTPLTDGDGFLWTSTRTGWNHLYRYDWNGELRATLTSGEWPVRAISHIGEHDVYFTAALDEERPYDVHVACVSLEGGAVKQLTTEYGIHAPSFTPDGSVFLDTHSTVDRPVRSELVRSDGAVIATVAEMDISKLVAFGYRAPEEYVVKAADGVTDLWGVMYKPYDFDPAKSYPVIEYIYGGPQAFTPQRSFSVEEDGYHHPIWALAHLGYVVVCLDGRGTPGRSKAFHDHIYGDWRAGVPDHIGGMRQLLERHSWMDGKRVGIFGHSWGGYFSLCAMIEAPEIYRACASSAAGPDPWDMIIWEPYLDLPSRNQAAYDDANLIAQAGSVKGNLLLSVGSSDHANINTTFKLVRALIDAEVDHELVVLPAAGHVFDGADREFYISKLVAFFDRHVMHRSSEGGTLDDH